MVVADRLIELLGTFDPLKLSCVSRCTILNKENEMGQWKCNVNFVSNYWPSTLVEVKFSNVKRIRLPEFGETSFLAFSELIIEDVRHFGMENINFSIVDHVNGFICDCENIYVDIYEGELN